MTPRPAVRDETADESDDSPADGVQGDYAGQQKREDHQRCAALPVAVSPRDRNCGNADHNRSGEDHSAGLGEPEPVTKPSPIGSNSRHARSLGQGMC